MHTLFLTRTRDKYDGTNKSLWTIGWHDAVLLVTSGEWQVAPWQNHNGVHLGYI